MKNITLDIFNNNINLLKINNGYYSSLCPFHKEKTPSFFINFKKNFFYCFGCLLSGKINNNYNNFLLNYFIKNKNKFNLIKNQVLEKKNFINDLVNKKLNLYKKILILKLINDLKDYYVKILFFHKYILKYLFDRNIKLKTIIKFSIGFCDFYNSKILIYNYQSYTYSIFFNIGSFKLNKEKFYNIFNNKIIFPIKNINGNVISFAGRNLNKKKPKYINSYKTFFFKKKKILYGLWENLFFIKKKKFVIVVEGYIDVLILTQNGFNNTIALMGSNLSIFQLNSILSLTSNIFFCFDGDLGGIFGIKKSLELIILNNLYYNNIKYCIFKNNLDPDNYINLFGRNKFFKKLLKSFSILKTIYLFYIKDIYVSNIIKLNKINDLKNFLKKIVNYNFKVKIIHLISLNKDITLEYFFYLFDNNTYKFKFNFKFKKLFYFFEIKFLNLFLIYPIIIIFLKKIFFKKFFSIIKNKLIFFNILNNIKLLNNKLNFIEMFLNINKSHNYDLYKYIILKNKDIKLYKLLNIRYIFKILNKISNLYNLYYFKNLL